MEDETFLYHALRINDLLRRKRNPFLQESVQEELDDSPPDFDRQFLLAGLHRFHSQKFVPYTSAQVESMIPLFRKWDSIASTFEEAERARDQYKDVLAGFIPLDQVRYSPQRVAEFDMLLRQWTRSEEPRQLIHGLIRVYEFTIYALNLNGEYRRSAADVTPQTTISTMWPLLERPFAPTNGNS